MLRPFFKEIILLAQIGNVENQCSISQFGNFEKKNKSIMKSFQIMVDF